MPGQPKVLRCGVHDENTKATTTKDKVNDIANFFMFKIEMAVMCLIKIYKILLHIF